MPVANEDIRKLSGQIFAHTAAYQVPALFAGREKEQESLAAFFASKERRPRVALVSDLLGSGKTFLVEMALRRADRTETGMLLSGTPADKMARQAEAQGFVGLDEWDIKAPPKVLVKSAENLNDYFRNANELKPVVVIGDRTLRDRAFRERLDKEIDLVDIDMEPLNPEFFDQALKNRVESALGEGAPADIVEPRLKRALVPSGRETVSVFREVLRCLKEMADKLPVDRAACIIGEREARAWLADKPLDRLKPDQLSFYRAFLNALRELRDVVIEPFSVADLRKLASWRSGDAILVDEVLTPLARGGLIGAIGNPSFSADLKAYDRYPGPYLPSPVTMVRALYGVIP